METTGKAFVATAGLLLAIGLLMVYSASITSRPTEFEAVYLSRQVGFLGLAIGCGLAAGWLPPRVWRAAAPWLFVLTVALLVIVLIPGVGTSVNGARRWLRVGGFTAQPSELAKIAVPMFVCWLAGDGRWRQGEWWRSTMAVAVPVGLLLGLVLCEPDLGTMLFLALSAALALYFCGWPLLRFAILLGPAIPLLAGMVILRPYQLARIQGFLATWRDFRLAPYQVRQSLTTLGSGGLWGTGLGLGEQKLSYLPEANTDFVFAVIGEELGLAGTLCVLGLWCVLCGLGLQVMSKRRRGSFEQALGLTLLAGLCVQAAMNMGVVLALLPPKGISLPLISYGGSNLIVSVTIVGLVVGLSRRASEQMRSTTGNSESELGAMAVNLPAAGPHASPAPQRAQRFPAGTGC